MNFRILIAIRTRLLTDLSRRSDKYKMCTPSKISRLLVWLLLFSIVNFAFAAAKESFTSQGPILDSRTKSYFELIDGGPGKYGNGPNWSMASTIAAQRNYKGRQGRLAVIPDIETLKFIESNFDISTETWTGLRYFCKYRKLLWVSGATQDLRSTAGLWARPWYRQKERVCEQQHRWDYMSIYLTSERSGPARFQATGPNKAFYTLLVEYPAPASKEDIESPPSSAATNESSDEHR